MLSPRWSKVLRDLWDNRARTVLVVLSIAVGIFAIGTIAGSQVLVLRDMNAAYMGVNPSSAILATDPFTSDFVDTVSGMREVRAAQGRRSLTVRLQVGPDAWHDLTLQVIPDYSDIRIDKIVPVRGAWPPPEHTLLVERASLSLVHAGMGDSITIKTPDNKLRQMQISGVTYDFNEEPAVFTGVGYGYITLDTLEWLGETRGLNTIEIVVAGDTMSKSHIQQVANKVRDKIEGSGYKVYYTYIPDPGKYPGDAPTRAMLLVMGVLGALAMLLSGLLVVNTLSALLTQQVRQIGIMKAIGGRREQIMAMYLTQVAMYGILALLVAVPLGALSARAFSGYWAGLCNFDIRNAAIPLQVFFMEVVIGLIVPLLAALYPVLVGTRITVREAISDYGISHVDLRTNMLDQLLRRFPGMLRQLSRPLLISLRNTFSRGGRLALTLVTLTLAGAIFIGVMSVNASLKQTLDDAMKYWSYDFQVNFMESQPVNRIEYEALKVPGIVKVETWGYAQARRVRADGAEGNNMVFLAPLVGTGLIKPQVLQGRWLLPGDENAIVLNSDTLSNEPDVKVGDSIVLKMYDRKSNWRVVGIVKSALSGPMAYANFPHFAIVNHIVGTSDWAYVVARKHDAASQSAIGRALEEHFQAAGLRVASLASTSDIRSQVNMEFDIIVVMLVIMAVLLAVTGGLGLMGTMSINVLERMREIGIMRAVGASDRAVMQIFVVEGVFIGFLSWVLGALVSLPLSKLLSDAVGISFMKAPLSYTFSYGGTLLWLVVVLVLATLASLFPARHAASLSVREVLAYQ